ncbi:MAG: hypothetical protein IMZ53_04905 [Thermoplasmata archaeon]|nr:hypothetical protein [Thermoplasmata archaeon]
MSHGQNLGDVNIDFHKESTALKTRLTEVVTALGKKFNKLNKNRVASLIYDSLRLIPENIPVVTKGVRYFAPDPSFAHCVLAAIKYTITQWLKYAAQDKIVGAESVDVNIKYLEYINTLEVSASICGNLELGYTFDEEAYKKYEREREPKKADSDKSGGTGAPVEPGDGENKTDRVRPENEGTGTAG